MVQVGLFYAQEKSYDMEQVRPTGVARRNRIGNGIRTNYDPSSAEESGPRKWHGVERTSTASDAGARCDWSSRHPVNNRRHESAGTLLEGGRRFAIGDGGTPFTFGADATRG